MLPSTNSIKGFTEVVLDNIARHFGIFIPFTIASAIAFSPIPQTILFVLFLSCSRAPVKSVTTIGISKQSASANVRQNPS